MSALLQVENLSVRYRSGATAVSGVSFDIRQGETTVVLGANGAGKTSLLRGVAGFWRTETGSVSGGRVIFDGKDITRKSPSEIARLGLAIVPETRKVFASATVEDNLRSVPRLTSKETYHRLYRTILELFPILGQRLSQQAGYLSGGERQMLGLARALLINPKLLLIDEATLGLAPVAIDAVFGRLESIVADLSTTIMLVEQNISAAMRIAQRVHVMETGKIAFSGTKDEMLRSGAVEASYFGGHAP